MSGAVLTLAGQSNGDAGIILQTGSAFSYGAGARTATYRLGSDGYVYHLDNGVATQQYQWKQTTAAASGYEASVNVLDGAVSGTAGSWLVLSSNRDWSITDALNDGVTATGQIEVKIRNASSLVVVATNIIDLSAERQA